MNTKELYLKTIFCCMACDGEIAKKEVALVHDLTSKQEIFKGIDVEATVNGYVASINAQGLLFLKDYLKELAAQNLSAEEQMKIIDLALQTIYADDKIEYAEVKFFKKIRSQLSLTDEEILHSHPTIEDFLLPDINMIEYPEWKEVAFNRINLSNYE